MAEKAAAAATVGATTMFESGRDNTDSDRLLHCLLHTAETWIGAAGWMPNRADAVVVQSAPMQSTAETATGACLQCSIYSIAKRYATI